MRRNLIGREENKGREDGRGGKKKTGQGGKSEENVVRGKRREVMVL